MTLMSSSSIHFRKHGASSCPVLKQQSYSIQPRKLGKQDYFEHFDSEIQLDYNHISRPFILIKGRLVLRTENLLRCDGIRVQLDATVNLKFETQLDHKRFGYNAEGLLAGSSAEDDEGYILSPVRVQLLSTTGVTPNEDQNGTKEVVIEPGIYAYPFELVMPEEPLPAPFSTRFGELKYRVGAYMTKVGGGHVKICQQLVTFRGYNNLNNQPNDTQFNGPKTLEDDYEMSMFCLKRYKGKIVLTVEKRGFLPGEEIPFKLVLFNVKRRVVKSVSVRLVRKITYKATLTSKTTEAILDTFETDKLIKDKEITWTGKLIVPANGLPTYEVNPVYSVVHLVQYAVITDTLIADYVWPIRGQTEVVIGTTREPVEVLKSLPISEPRRMTLEVEDELQLTHRGRSSSVVSRLSDKSDSIY